MTSPQSSSSSPSVAGAEKFQGAVAELYGFVAQHVYAYKDEPMTLASGKKSRHYFNCKMLTFNPAGLELLVRVLYEELDVLQKQTGFRALGGLTMGPDPFIYGLAMEAARRGEPEKYLPLIARKEAKDHGTGKQIEGKVSKGLKVLLVDDVITTGGSSIKALDALRREGFEVEHAWCLIDRQEGGSENLTAQGVTLHSLFKKEDFYTGDRLAD